MFKYLCKKRKYLTASTEVKQANNYLIVVPTPFKSNKEPDISYVVNATEMILPFLKENDLFIIESTSPIGTTDFIKTSFLKKDLN